LVNRGKPASRLEEEAARWAARIDASPDTSPAGLDRWLRADAAHAGALLRAQATLVMLGGAAPEALALEQEAPARRRWLLGGAGVALAASITAAALLLPARGEQIRTGIGEVRSVARWSPALAAPRAPSRSPTARRCSASATMPQPPSASPSAT
jgi:transmembrane sensor